MASTLASHQVKVTIVEAQNLSRTNDWNEGSDSYCEVRLHGKTQEGTPIKTTTQKQTLAPKWNESFNVELSHSPMNDTLEIFVFGEKMLGKLFIGRVEIPVTLLLHGAMVDGWFKLLPQALTDLSKTVTGHIHLILHYSQVQVPIKTPEKNKKTSSTAYPGNAPTVNCPICNRAFSTLTINQHLDLCTQAPPTTTATTTTSTRPKGDIAACPVCCKTFPVPELNRHLESCLASQSLDEPKQRPKATLQPTSESEEAAQLQAVLIASKLEAEKEKEKKKKDQTPSSEPQPITSIEATPPPSGYTSVYPSLPYMPYPGPVPLSGPVPTGMPMPGPFMPPPYMPFPDTQQPDGQPAIPQMCYFPPMYPPYYPPPTGQPMMGVPPGYGTPTSPTPTPTPPPKTDLLF